MSENLDGKELFCCTSINNAKPSTAEDWQEIEATSLRNRITFRSEDEDSQLWTSS